ncbi:MAG: hypothetical protein QW407_04555, partial [Thermofilaceae archaeon]
MGEEDPQRIVQLGYYKALKDKLLEVTTVFLLGPRYNGKTTGIMEATRELGRIEHIDLQKPEEFQRAHIRVTKGGEGLAVIEGTAYRLAYALRIGGGWMDSEAYWNWLKEKDNAINKVLKDKNTVIAELDDNDVEKLLDYFGAEKDERKRRQLVRLASIDGQVIIPLLERVVCEHGQKDLKELERMADSEEKLTGFIKRMLLIERSSWVAIGRKILDIAAELAEFLQPALPQIAPVAYGLNLAKRVVSIPLGLSSLRLSSEGIYSNIIALREAWKKLPVKKRVVICEEIDEKLGLPPGSSYEFLESWLGGSERQFLEEISRTLTPDFITQLRQIVDKYEDVKKELDNISEDLKKLRNELKEELEKIAKVVENLTSFTFIYNSLNISCEEVYPIFMQPAEIGVLSLDVFQGDWIGLGVDMEKNIIYGSQSVQLVKSVEFESYAKEIEEGLKNGEFVIVVGNRGIGKSILTRYVLAKLIRENDNLWVVTPSFSKSGRNWPEALATQANVFHRRFHTHIIIYYDPSAPEVYGGIEKTGTPGAVEEDMIEAVRGAYVNARATGGVSALLVIPSDFEEIIYKISKKLEKHKVKAHIIELDLRQKDFLRDIIKAYSGCEVIPDELVEGVREFSSYTLIAKLVGEWLRGKCDKAQEEVKAALKESEKNAKRFIARYIWEAIFQKNVKLVKIEAIPLLIRAYFSPIPRKFFEKPFTIRDGELIIQDIFDVIKQDEPARAFTTWLSTLKEDLIEEVLREIVRSRKNKLGEEFEKFINAVREGRRIILRESKSKRLKKGLVSLLSEYLFEMLQQELEGEAVECWRRVIYILGSTISGYPFEPSFTAFRELYGGEELFKIAEGCEVDDWLLVNGEVPPFVRVVILKTAGSLSFITPRNWICEEAEKVAGFIARKGISLPLVPYMVGLAFASLNTCKDNREAGRNALYLLHCSLIHFGPLAEPDLIPYIVAAVGESLKWPEELTPILSVLSNLDTYSDEHVKSVSKIANQLYEKKNKMKGWAKAYLAKTYSQLSLVASTREAISEYLRRAEELREEVKKEVKKVDKVDEKMGLITDVEILDDIVGANFMLGEIGEAEKALEDLSEALQKFETEGEGILQSDCVKEYLRHRSLEKAEEAIQRILEEARMKHLHARALIELNKGVQENDKDRLSKAAEDFSKAAELARNLGEEENYVILRGKSAMVRVLSVDKLNEEVLKEFEEIWRIALESLRPTRGHISRLAFALAKHLVALALSGGDWGELLEEYRFLLEFDPRLKVATLYMLNILAGCKEKPSDEEAYLAAGVME